MSTYSIRPVEEMNPELRKMLEARSEMVANEYMLSLDGYCLMHIRTRPWWMPKKVWHFILSRFIILTMFHVPKI